MSTPQFKNENGQYGPSKPHSEAKPSETDIKVTQDLEEVLRDYGAYDTPEQATNRKQVMKALDSICNEWVVEECKYLGWTDKLASECKAVLLPFGSYSLGCHSAAADIDLCLIAPEHIERDAFFDTLQFKLHRNTHIKDLSAVPNAYVPVIKFKFDGVDIDLVFCKLPLSEVPEGEFDLFDDMYLEGMDPKSVLSINGPRVAAHTINLVPNKENYRVFLRSIKLWAKNRGVYSNVFGFLAGVSCQILAAKICQLYPNAAPNILFKMFFSFYMTLGWRMPIYIQCKPSPPPATFAKEPLAIMTPVYPAMNSTHNASATTISIINEEVSRAQALTAKLKPGCKSVLEDLFKESDFFFKFKDFLMIEAYADSAEKQYIWIGWVESKMRQLILLLGNTPNVKCVPYPYRQCSATKEHPFSHAFFFGLTFDVSSGEKKNVDLSFPVLSFRNVIMNNWERQEGMEMDVRSVKGRGLPEYCFKDDRRPGQKKKKVSTPGQKKKKKTPKKQPQEQDQEQQEQHHQEQQQQDQQQTLSKKRNNTEMSQTNTT